MKLTNTACLAALLLTCPLVAPQNAKCFVFQGNYYGVYKYPDDSGVAKASGYKEKPAGKYDNVYTAFATDDGGEKTKALEANNNEGTLGKNLIVNGSAWGGYAWYNKGGDSDCSVQANSNTLVLENGVTFSTSSDDVHNVIGGDAFSSNNGNACQNTVTFETGVAGDFENVYGGNVQLNGNGKKDGSASNNTVVINEKFDGTIFEIAAGKVTDYKKSVAEGAITASDNELYITIPTAAEIDIIEIGSANTNGYSDDDVDAYGSSNSYANKNSGKLVLNESTQLYLVRSGQGLKAIKEMQKPAKTVWM